MVKLYNNFNINQNHKQSIILIGNFDGVHLGHQKLFKLAQSYKKKYNSKIGVINFDPFPKMFFNKSLKNFRLSSMNQKLNLLNNLGIDFMLLNAGDEAGMNSSMTDVFGVAATGLEFIPPRQFMTRLSYDF